ncbi:MAG: hypothetical protein JWP71_1797 [Mucilaginibacter sp.]|nr:hypothetical protein [Mucilaginibacter sp.]
MVYFCGDGRGGRSFIFYDIIQLKTLLKTILKKTFDFIIKTPIFAVLK